MTPDKTSAQTSALLSALAWHRDIGADMVLEDTPQNHLEFKAKPIIAAPASPVMPPVKAAQPVIMGSGALKDEATRIAAGIQTLEDLKAAIQNFEGVEAKKTASQMVFADGKAGAPLMVIGDAPATDEDRAGKPFMGVHGAMLDKALGFIGCSRTENVYMCNILSWRPPGNRTPTAAEIDISLPFVQKHIELARPKIILLAGAVATKVLLGTAENITKLRGRAHVYACANGTEIPVVVTYHPSYLLRTPTKKAEAWADFLKLKLLLG